MQMDNDAKLKRFFEIALIEKISTDAPITVLVVCEEIGVEIGRDARAELAPGKSPVATFSSVMRCIFQILARGKKNRRKIPKFARTPTVG
jgi:hypothetical protein